MTIKKLLTGNEACTYAAVNAGARFFAGYPITPATEIVEMCSELMPAHNGVFIQMEDEIASIAAVIGASLGGTKAFTATSGPGFALMSENIGFAAMAEAPCVIINVQRYGPSTGIATKFSQSDVMAVRWGSPGDHSLIVLAPSSVQDCYNLTVEAFNLSERFRTPVILLSDAALAHLREKVEIRESGELNLYQRENPSGPVDAYLPYGVLHNDVPVMSNFGDDYILRVTGLVHQASGYSSDNPQVAEELVQRLARKIDNYQEELPAPIFHGPQPADFIVVSFGISARASLEAVNSRGLKAGMLELRTIWPFPGKRVKELCSGAKKILVVEANRGQVRELLLSCGFPPEILKGVNKQDAEVIAPSEILSALKEENS
ncbi:MAG TPA: 2-oxoacid:acceptor oxidoreductase subunit alpha [Desulfotomaculum sp.]|nr:MAG: 2-oxoacid:ferredoxin oxidoreductase, alpha subunit [Desulfotomaculum sp. 46_80]HAG10286.1 2-oxoacid:acceptor oxidoreductase subunit alpha [Desulfotomaculum sp.]HBY04096.1 2-oxoacid:acceptor oxidoreductase subunit alpha [Desulfotomaculum sp.]